MLVDLTTQPLTLSMDEAPGELVVRTWAAFGASGLLHRQYEDGKSERPFKEEIKPGCQLPMGGTTVLESRIPLFAPFVNPVCTFCGDLPESKPTCFVCKGRDVRILKDPWEVATGTRDVLTSRTSTWRARLQASPHPKNPDLWVVSIGIVGEKGDLVRFATKSLSIQLFKREPLPLQKHYLQITGTAPTQWERLMEDE